MLAPEITFSYVLPKTMRSIADLGGGMPLPGFEIDKFQSNTNLETKNFKMPTYNIVVFAGDHCGQEVTPEALKVSQSVTVRVVHRS